MRTERIGRVNDEIKKELSEIIRFELKDPRLNAETSVTSVKTSSDLRHCKVYVSVMGDEKAKNDALAGLDSSLGFIRKQIAERINLRLTPEFAFAIDDSLDYGMKIDGILRDIKREGVSDETD
ncbi:MAG: 30S ribosome-binding factor RbfA [Clostridiales bacterium]|jgi:ribosome-binding factor A|nr:30S ribosome-binding factor RbfA [Clostridiales bacterium]